VRRHRGLDRERPERDAYNRPQPWAQPRGRESSRDQPPPQPAGTYIGDVTVSAQDIEGAVATKSAKPSGSAR